MSPGAEKDFFISYAQADTAWAQWIAEVLEESGHTVVYQRRDCRPGDDFMAFMEEGLTATRAVVAVLSPSYVDSQWCKREYQSALRGDPGATGRAVIPVRVEPCEPPVLLGTRVFVDIHGCDEAEARERLVDGVGEHAADPAGTSVFPGGPGREVGGTFPGTLPECCHIPHRRNPRFTGRDDLLAALERQLDTGATAALTQAIAGLGGIGKTQLALEYCHRHAHAYAGVWWFVAETPATLFADYGRLARALGLPDAEASDQGAMVECVRRRLAREPRPWLLVFDNSPGAESLTDWLPHGGSHHVLVTSRSQSWRSVAEALTVETWSRDASVDFLLSRTGSVEREEARTLSGALGDLPLALEQAGAYMDVSGRSIDEYLALYRSKRMALLERAPLQNAYPDTVATTWAMSFDAIEATTPAGAEILSLAAFFAPDAIPRWLLVNGAPHLPEALRAVIADEFLLDDAIAELRRHSLLEVTGDTWSVHRLVQTVTRDRLGDAAGAWAERAVGLANDAFPFDLDDVATWWQSEALLPHVLTAARHAETLRVAPTPVNRLLNKAGQYLLHHARFSEARTLLVRALAMSERAHGRDHPVFASCASSLGQLLQAQGEFDAALECARHALTVFERVHGTDSPDVAKYVGNVGQMLQDQDDLAGALEYARRALTLGEKAHGPEHPSIATRASNVGQILKEQGDLAGALEYSRRALTIDEKTHGHEHPTVAIRANNIGTILHDQGELTGAIEYLERALAVAEKVYGPEHPLVATIFNNIGQVRQDQGDLAGALEHARHALAIDEKIYGLSHPSVGRDANNIGQLLHAMGDLAGALEQTERAVAIKEAALGGDHSSTKIAVAHLEGLKAASKIER